MNTLAYLWAKNIHEGKRPKEQLDGFPAAFRESVLQMVTEMEEKEAQANDEDTGGTDNHHRTAEQAD